jgi:transposase
MASLCGVNRKTMAFHFLRLCEIIAYELEAESEAMFGGEIEVDESYFGGRRKGKRGRRAAGKIPVFGLLKGVEKFTLRLSRMLQEPL